MNIFNWLARAYQAYLRRKNLQRVVRFMAIVVVFCTTYALILPAITMESGTICGLTEHTHTDACYEMAAPEACTLPEQEPHFHTDACYTIADPVPCDLPETAAHHHTDACYRDVTELSCTLAEIEAHRHSRSCIDDGCVTVEESTSYVCGKQETDGHTHGDDCYHYEEKLTCTLPVTKGHRHTEECMGVLETRVNEDGEVQEITGFVCGEEEYDGHDHGDGCTTQVKVQDCDLAEEEPHRHSDACIKVEYREILPAAEDTVYICGKEETAGHSHDAGCRTPVLELVCGLDEDADHTHDDDCYAVKKELSCGKQETDGHTHDASCATVPKELICGLEEGEDHSHDDACYADAKKLICGKEETPGHSHADDSTEPVRVCICGLEEHKHDESCYPVTEPSETVEETLPEEADPTADVETAADWEAGLSSVVLTGDWSEDLLAVARTQLGYTESRRNYIEDENGVIHGYTRYGQWYGDPYADWSTTFVSFCLNYARIPGIEPQQDCQTWLYLLQNAGIYRFPSEYTPVPGDIMFLDRDGDGLADQMGIVERITQSEDGGMMNCQIIAGDCDGKVDRIVMDATYQGVLGYAVLPVEPVKESYEILTEDGIFAEVYLGEDTSVPGSSRLHITTLDESSDQYAAMAEQIKQVVSGEVDKITLLDISFFSAAGDYLPVSDTATVSITYPGQITDPGLVKVFHFVDGAPVEVNGVNCQSISTFAARDADSQTLLTFETDGFSVFAVVEVAADNSRITLTYPAELDGNAYYIVSNNNQYCMLDYSSNGTGLALGTYNAGAALTGKPVWTFHMQQDGTFLIESNSGKYLVMEDTDADSATLQTTEDATEATAFTIQAVGGQAEISYDGPNGKAHYLNVFNGDSDFRGWHQGTAQDPASKVYLHAAEVPEEQVTVSGLGGKEVALVTVNRYPDYNKALATASTGVNNVTGLTARDMTISTIAGVRYVDGDAPLWTFHETDTEGVYTISTQVDGETKYLRLLDSAQTPDNPDGRGSLTLGEPQNIAVIANGDGSVSLSATVGGRTGYVNLDGSYNFWTYKENAESCRFFLCETQNVDSAFSIVYNNRHRITVECRDTAGNKLYVEPETKTFSNDGSERKPLAEYAPAIDGYIFTRALFSGIEVGSIGPFGDNDFRLYEPDYVAEPDNGKFYTRHEDVTVTFEYRDTSVALSYNLAKPTDSWIDVTPAIPADSQRIYTRGALYDVTGINVAGTYKYVADTASGSMEIVNYYKAQNADKGAALTAENYMAPGSEYKFLGWQATTTDGRTVILAPNSEVTVNADGTATVASGEAVYTLAGGTRLTGQWQKVSDLIQLFVNFNSTMLSTETSVTVGTGAHLYTNNIAFGRVYNASDLSSTTASRNNHEQLAQRLVTAYNPDSTACQIVLDAVYIHGATADSGQYVTIDNGADEDAVNEYVMNYIRTNPDTSRQIRVKGIKIDRSTITAENYGLYWYSMKHVSADKDAYHLDGILIANTAPINIRKTFSGLGSQEVDQVKESMRFPVRIHGSDHQWYDYVTMAPNSSEAGVYEFVNQLGAQNIFTWKLNAIQGQKYAFAEEDYDLEDHDVATLLSVHFLDPNKPAKYLYYADDTAAYETVFGDLEGSDVGQVVFANFYTRTGTGMFTISKTSSVNSSLRLPGAKFTLRDYGLGRYYTYDSATGEVTWSSTEAIYTTNSYGSIHFCDLEPGVYILTEIESPDGYLQPEKYWTVYVKQTGSNITVEITDSATEVTTLVYDSQQNDPSIPLVYNIDNTPITDTLNVTASFSLTEGEFDTIKDNYGITITKTDGTDTRVLGISDAVKNMDGSYSWLLRNMVGEYTVVQTGLAHADYKDTVSTVELNGNAVSAGSADQYTITLGSGEIDNLSLINTYTNTFRLHIKKTDPSGNPLSGARFYVCTPNQSEAPGGALHTYKDADGNVRRVYTLLNSDETGVDGITVCSNLRLGVGYVLIESQAPDGFVKLDTPVELPRMAAGVSGYRDGTYTVEVVNSNTVNVIANIVWDVLDGTTPPSSVNLTLYRSSDGGTAERVETLPVSSRSADLQYIWSGLNKDYTYYVVQEEVAGYNTAYSTGTTLLTVGNRQVYAAPATEGTEMNRSVTITNTTGYELPETGGSGAGRYITPGLLLILAVCCLYPLGTIRKKRQGGLE